MNTIWSVHIQGVMTLYLSRRLRFDDIFAEQYQKLFRLDPQRKLKILEIGCGPGALAEALHRWYPKAQITAIDRDSQFIASAKLNASGVRFLEGDATSLPFKDGTFDVTISNTVQEHIAPAAFWGEQLRVLKPGGVCLCLSSRKGIHHAAPCLEMTKEEQAFWDLVPPSDDFEKYQVGKYAVSEAELPALMERAGFANVTTGYAVADLTPDDPKFPPGMAEMMIEANHINDIEALASAVLELKERETARVMDGPGQPAEQVPAWQELGLRAGAAVHAKYEERLRQYRAGEKQWDTDTSVIMVLRGVKP